MRTTMQKKSKKAIKKPAPKPVVKQVPTCPECGGVPFAGSSLVPEHHDFTCPYRYIGGSWIKPHVAPCDNPDCGDPICVAAQQRELDADLHYDEATNPSNGWEAPDVVDDAEVALVPVQSAEDKTKKEDFQQQAEDARPTTLNEIFDRYTKKLYLIDVSGSMSSKLQPEDETVLYNWPAETLQQFRVFVRDKIVTQYLTDAGESGIKEEIDAYAAKVVAALSDDDLKRYVLAHEYHKTSGIQLSKNYQFEGERKIEAVRGAMQTFAERRFKQFPDAQVGLMVFDDETEIKVQPGAQQLVVLEGIQKLSNDVMYRPGHGGTHICQAVERAIELFEKNPSQVRAHHIILVTDGEDHSALAIEHGLLERMKKLNVMLDFIYVSDGDPSSSYQDVAESLKRVCETTGGQYAEVAKSTDFQTKFLQASARLALPPARG